MTTARRIRVGALAAALAASGVLATGVGERVAVAAPRAAGSWEYPNGDLDNTRDVVGSTITSANVGSLKVAWTFSITGKAAKSLDKLGSLVANPVVVGSVVYVQDMYSNVYALSLATGAKLWEYWLGQALRSGPGPNGVAVSRGVVYALAPTEAFALDASTGHPIWIDRHLLGHGQGTFGMQPQVANGRVYLASQYGAAPGGGILLALRASNGRRLWTFNTVKTPDAGVESLGLGAGGAWETPLVGSDGSVTYGTGNPYQTVGSAISEPARQLYTNSLVNLDAATGRLRWYYQGVPNDFKDYDMQASPIAARVGATPVVIGGGKMGFVYEMNAHDGRLVWKAPVGEHNGHDNDSLNALEHRGTLKLPFSFLPGSFGGILTNMAVAGQSVFVDTCDLELRYTKLSQVTGQATATTTAKGEVEALNLATGKVEWDTKVSGLPLGAATVVNDLVVTTLFNGVLIALNRQTGAIVYHRKLAGATNATLAVAGNTIIVPEGDPGTTGVGHPAIVAYRLG
ncbi:MAG: PQQ-binding-like beta-propeller repeat protein [Acidimicrobiales bacterium]